MKDIKLKLSSAIISDVLEEMGFLNQMLSIKIKPNFIDAKIFGKARIITLKKLEKREDYSKVYKGLYFIESMNKGDLLIVANAFDNCAFFGELMSTLARYKGIEGVIIDGCTRDKLETIKMNYPIFSKDNIARDIKNRGVVDKIDLINAKVGGVIINKGDYLFGDLDGVVVIPYKIREEVILKSFKKVNLESKIKKSLKLGVSTKKLFKDFGEF